MKEMLGSVCARLMGQPVPGSQSAQNTQMEGKKKLDCMRGLFISRPTSSCVVLISCFCFILPHNITSTTLISPFFKKGFEGKEHSTGTGRKAGRSMTFIGVGLALQDGREGRHKTRDRCFFGEEFNRFRLILIFNLPFSWPGRPFVLIGYVTQFSHAPLFWWWS